MFHDIYHFVKNDLLAWYNDLKFLLDCSTEKNISVTSTLMTVVLVDLDIYTCGFAITEEREDKL